MRISSLCFPSMVLFTVFTGVFPAFRATRWQRALRVFDAVAGCEP